MCGRFTLRVTGEAFERQFGITRAPSFNQHFNIAPGRCVVVVTCEAEGGDRSIHPRMPVILPQTAYSTWLDPKSGLDSLRSLLRAYRGLRHTAVSTLVNDPANDGPECLRELRVR
jgi:putative SOS response-associated peptidase YedK